MTEPIVIRPERPDHPQVAELLAALDAYLAALYAPEANHILDLQALRDPRVDFLAAWSGEQLLGCGYRPRGPFAGYPDNGLSLFYAKELAA